MNVPHSDGWRLSKRQLEEVVDPDEMSNEARQTLEAVADDTEVWCLVRFEDTDHGHLHPHAESIQQWRRLFHLAIDAAVDAVFSGLPGDDAAIASRIDRIGQIPFDEIRVVLRQEDRLFAAADDRSAYREFCALFFELTHFEPQSLPIFFPTLSTEALQDVAELLGNDVDAAALFDATRPADTPCPRQWAETQRHEDAPIDRFVVPDTAPLEELEREAQEANGSGNLIRYAMLLRRIGAGTTDPLSRQRYDDLSREALGAMVKGLLGSLDRVETLPTPAQLAEALWPLVGLGAGSDMAPAVRILLDLQRVMLEATDPDFYALDLYGWLTSLGRTPLRRALPTDRLARRVRTLRRARYRVGRLSLLPHQRQRLSRLLLQVQRSAETGLRDVLVRVLDDGLREVGLTASSTVEHVARDKIVNELIDQVVDGGGLHIGHVRDALSRNALKLKNIPGPISFLKGDELLRLDRYLTRQLGGVYRRGEAYMRGLQRTSSLLFGTRFGQAMTRFVLLPFGGAFVALEGFDHVIMPLVRLVVPTDFRVMGLTAFLVTSCVLFGLLHHRAFRHAAMQTLQAIGRVVRIVCMTMPKRVWLWPPWQRVWTSGPLRALRRYLFKPLLVGGSIWVIVPLVGGSGLTNAISGGMLFIAANLGLNSKMGRRLEERLHESAWQTWSNIRYRLIPGLFRWTLRVFRVGLEMLERGLYRVDEFLRFRKGDPTLKVLVKSFTSVVWGTLTYIVRIYVNLLIEPQVNPIKHFPVVTVAHKLMLPALPELTRMMLVVTEPLMGPFLGTSFTLATIFLLPGIAGFLVWEFKENWRLYAENRSEFISPSIIGHHSETMLRFMRPGFHSGTLPKLYGKLRRARGSHAASRAREGLTEVAHAVASFIDRELTRLLHHSPAWSHGELAPSQVRLASNLIEVTLRSMVPSAGEAVVLRFEEQSGWLVASIARPGWLLELDQTQLALFGLALSGLYKRAGVDLVREHIRDDLGPVQAYDIADEGLIVWPGPGYATRHIVDLHDATRHGLIFRERSLSWTQWSYWCDAHEHGGTYPTDPLGKVLPELASPGRHATS